jgi:hypothetical protein
MTPERLAPNAQHDDADKNDQRGRVLERSNALPPRFGVGREVRPQHRRDEDDGCDAGNDLQYAVANDWRVPPGERDLAWASVRECYLKKERLRLSVSPSGEPDENGSEREPEHDVGQARHALAPGIRQGRTIWAVGPRGSPPPLDVLIDRVDSGEDG